MEFGISPFGRVSPHSPRTSVPVIVAPVKTTTSLPVESSLRTATLCNSESAGRAASRSPAELERLLHERDAQVRQQARQLRAMGLQLVQVEQQERARLAAILHDHVQPLLLSARLQLSVVNPGRLPAAGRNALGKVDETLGTAMRDCRSLAVDLNPPVLHQAGLGAALEWLARRMGELHRFTVHLEMDRQAEPPAGDLRIFLFGATRELLLNSCKHSGCTSARVTTTREADDWMRIVIEDAGKGFDLDVLKTDQAGGAGFGLSSIQQRLAPLGARMEWESIPGVQTRIAIIARSHGGAHRAAASAFPEPKGTFNFQRPSSGVQPADGGGLLKVRLGKTPHGERQFFQLIVSRYAKRSHLAPGRFLNQARATPAGFAPAYSRGG